MISMKKIKVFIGSSIEDLAYERRDIVSFIAELNNQYVDRGIYIEPYICEEKPSELRSEGSQAKHDEYIRNNADAMIFMFFQKAGQYTMRELQIAWEVVKNESKNSCVLIFFKTQNNSISDSEEIKKAIDKISGEYAHYYKKFSETDTIKLELLQYLSRVLAKNNTLSIVDGKVYIGDIEANDLILNNVFAYQNNKELNDLRSEIYEYENKMQLCILEKNWTEFDKLVKHHKEKQEKYNALECNILRMLKLLFETTIEKNTNPIRLRALSLLEEGDYVGALKLFPLDSIEKNAKNIIEKKSIQDKKIRYEAHNVLEDAKTRIYSLRFDIRNENIDQELLLTYDSIVDIAIIDEDIQMLLEYVDLLIDTKNNKRANEVLHTIELNINRFNSIDLYSKFDMYNLLGELSDNAKDQEFYSQKATNSLIDFMNSIDESDIDNYIDNYIDNCIRLHELVDGKISLPFLLKTVEMVENDETCLQINEDYRIVELYLYTAEAYDNIEDRENYELFLLKAKECLSHFEISFDEMREMLKTNDSQECINDKSIIRNYYMIIRVYEDLYLIDNDRYGIEYITQLLIVAGLYLSYRHWNRFLDYLEKAHSMAKNNPNKYLGIVELYIDEYMKCMSVS